MSKKDLLDHVESKMAKTLSLDRQDDPDIYPIVHALHQTDPENVKAYFDVYRASIDALKMLTESLVRSMTAPSGASSGATSGATSSTSMSTRHTSLGNGEGKGESKGEEKVAAKPPPVATADKAHVAGRVAMDEGEEALPKSTTVMMPVDDDET